MDAPNVVVYRSDGSIGGTQPVSGFPIRPAGSISPSNWVTIAGRNYFLFDGNSAGYTVWSVGPDGSAVREPLGLFSTSSLYGPIVEFDSQPFFLQVNCTGSEYQWNVDTLSKEVHISAGNGVANLTPTGNRLLMLASEGNNPFQLYVYDPAVTSGPKVHPVLNNGGPGYTSQLGGLKTVGNLAAFTAYDPINGHELWLTDGTANGTRVIDVDPDPDSSSPTLLASVGNTLVFTAYDGKKRMLYALTGGGTPEPLREVTSDPQLILAGDHLYGLVQSSEGTFFVSIADGGGITNFRDADPAHAFTGPSQFTEAGGSVYYVDYLPAVSKKVVWKIVDSSHLVPVETQMDHVGQIAGLNGVL